MEDLAQEELKNQEQEDQATRDAEDYQNNIESNE